jgi:hypothetical protein
LRLPYDSFNFKNLSSLVLFSDFNLIYLNIIIIILLFIFNYFFFKENKFNKYENERGIIKIQGNRTILVPYEILPEPLNIKFNKYIKNENRLVLNRYGISNLMRKGRIVAIFLPNLIKGKRSIWIGRDGLRLDMSEEEFQHNVKISILGGINSKLPVKLSLYNILIDSNFVYGEVKNRDIEFLNRLRNWPTKINPYDERRIEDYYIVYMITTILKEIFYPRFSKYSYSTKKYSRALNAIINIKNNLNKKKWIIKGSIPFSQKINIKILMKILSKVIKDKKFLFLINDVFNKGYYNYNDNVHWFDMINKTFSYNILNKGISPNLNILYNIYLNEFDIFIEKLQKNNKSNFFYVRYNDQFIIGLNNENDYTNISLEINKFLFDELSLEVKLKKFNILKNYVEFLGYHFWRKNNNIILIVPVNKIIINIIDFYSSFISCFPNINLCYFPIYSVISIMINICVLYMNHFSIADNNTSLFAAFHKIIPYWYSQIILSIYENDCDYYIKFLKFNLKMSLNQVMTKPLFNNLSEILTFPLDFEEDIKHNFLRFKFKQSKCKIRNKSGNNIWLKYRNKLKIKKIHIKNILTIYNIYILLKL